MSAKDYVAEKGKCVFFDDFLLLFLVSQVCTIVNVKGI